MKPPTAMALWALLLLAPVLRTSAAPPPELILIRTQFDKAVTERVEAPHAAALDELTATYGAALDRAITASKAAGDLESVVAMEEEKGLIEQGKPIPAAGVAPAPLAALRPIYHRQLAVIEEKKRADHLAVLTPYLATLRSLEATLTKTDRIVEAKEILAYRKSVETSSSVSAPVAGAATPSAPAKPAPFSGGVPMTLSGANTPHPISRPSQKIPTLKESSPSGPCKAGTR